MPVEDAQPDDSQDHVADGVQAAPAAPGVPPVDVEPDPADGLALLRLELTPGADERDVARAVDEHLRRRAAQRRSPSDTGPRQPARAVDGEPLAVVTSGRLPQTHRQKPAPESAAGDETSLRPAPDVTGEASRTIPEQILPVVLPDTQGRGARLGLELVQLVTRGPDVTAMVVLRDAGRQHTGVCEAAAAPGGQLRSLATATAQAMESAAGGRCRFTVEAVEVTSVSGRETAVAVLSTVSDRGTEVLTGACRVGDDPQRAMVKAVLAASNRRMSLQLASP